MKSPDRSIFAPAILRVADELEKNPKRLRFVQPYVERGRRACWLALIGEQLGLPDGTVSDDVARILGYTTEGPFIDDLKSAADLDGYNVIYPRDPASALRAYVREYCR